MANNLILKRFFFNSLVMHSSKRTWPTNYTKDTSNICRGDKIKNNPIRFIFRQSPRLHGEEVRNIHSITVTINVPDLGNNPQWDSTLHKVYLRT